MESTEIKQKSSRSVSLFLLVPALLLGLISLVMAIVGLGLIPILPALAGMLLCVVSLILFKKSYRNVALIIIGISIVAALVSVFRGSIMEQKIASDKTFDSTLVRTQQGIENDLNEAFDDSIEVSDTTIAPIKVTGE